MRKPEQYYREIVTAMLAVFFVFHCVPLISKDRRPSYPYVTGDGFRACADYVYDEDICTIEVEKIRAGDVIFVKPELFEEFFHNYHPKIEHKYILITHNSDIDIPGKYACFLDDPKLIAWFGQNVYDYSHPKLIPIPIGLTNRYNPLGDPGPITAAVRAARQRRKQRSILAYFNVNLQTNLQARQKVYDYFYPQNFCTVITETIPFQVYLNNVLKSKFVISPRGNGLDCHRTWEALYLGSIPVVQRSKMDAVFDDLPVLIIDAWEEVTEEFLLQKYQEFSGEKYDFSKLYMDFWQRLINSYKTL